MFLVCYSLCVVFIRGLCMVVCNVTVLSTTSVFLLGILIARGVAKCDRWIISCWFGCSQDVSFALRVNICFYVWGHWVFVSWEIQFSMPGSWCSCEGCVFDLMGALCLLDSFGSAWLFMLAMALVILVCYDFVFAILWFVTATRWC